MKVERWRRLESLYNQAVGMEQGQRTAFLREACSDDEDLQRDLEELFAEEPKAAGFLEKAALREIAHEFAATENSARSSWIGRHVGNYEFLSLLGVGGMGEIYRARDSKLKREVAIKVLPDEFSRDADRIGRFEREAQLLASLNHPNIAAIYDLEESTGIRLLILELVPGETLAERLKRGPIPLGDALQIAVQIAEGLGAAHERGILHRDLKPANIKLTPDGKVKVLDFGLAKAFAGDAANPSNAPTKIPATTPGMILGTAAYMSPEQANGYETQRTTDVWAFGCVLYEMVTGYRAFEGETFAEILANVMRAAPDWTRLPDNTPAGIRSLLRRCLRKEERLRLRDVRDARLEIDDVRDAPNERERAVVPAPPRGRMWLAWVVSTAAAVAITAFAVTYFRAPAGSPEARLYFPAFATSDPGSFALSPDGLWVVLVASEEVEAGLWLRSLDGVTKPLAGTKGARRPFWSPDSHSVAFFADNKLRVIDIGGGLPQVRAEAPSGTAGTWSSNGVILFAGLDNLYRLPASGTEKPTALPKPDAQSRGGRRFPHFLPDGRQFLFFSQGQETQGIYLGSLDSTETRFLTAADTGGAYLPPGWLLFVRQGRLVARRFDLASGKLTGDPVTVAEPVEFDGGLYAGAFSVSTSGVVAYRAWGERQLTWFDRSGKPLGTMGDPDKYDLGQVELSPDGRRVATTRTVEGNQDIFLLDGVRTSRFTINEGIDWFPSWSPDGSRILFNSRLEGNRTAISVKPSNGGGSETRLGGPGGAPNDWSPTGFLLWGGAGLWTQPLDGNGNFTGEPRLFVNTISDERWGQFSPDGRWVAYQSNEEGPYEIYVRPFPGPGEQWKVSISGGIQARWNQNGKELYYIAPDGKLMAVPIAIQGASLDRGIPAPLFQTQIWGKGTGVLYKQQYDVASDGRFLINVALGDPPITVLQNWKPPAK